MFDTIIVPLDGSSHAEFAIPYAIDEARRHSATMVLVHIIPRPEPCPSTVRRSGPLPRQGEWPSEEIDTAKRDAHAYLQGVVTRFALDPGTAVCVAVGDPRVRLAAEAKRHARPLVVMVTGDCTREPRPPLSLVATYLLVAGAVPVLGIRQPPPTIWSAGPDADDSTERHPSFTRSVAVTAPAAPAAVSYG